MSSTAHQPTPKELDQQGVVALRPDDQILLIQNGREKRLLVKTFVDAILQMQSDIDNAITEAEMADALALADHVTHPELTAGLGTKQDYVAPSSAITDPATSVASVSILGINVITLAAAQTDRDKIIAILAALRVHGIIVP